MCRNMWKYPLKYAPEHTIPHWKTKKLHTPPLGRFAPSQEVFRKFGMLPVASLSASTPVYLELFLSLFSVNTLVIEDSDCRQYNTQKYNSSNLVTTTTSDTKKVLSSFQWYKIINEERYRKGNKHPYSVLFSKFTLDPQWTQVHSKRNLNHHRQLKGLDRCFHTQIELWLFPMIGLWPSPFTDNFCLSAYDYGIPKPHDLLSKPFHSVSSLFSFQISRRSAVELYLEIKP